VRWIGKPRELRVSDLRIDRVAGKNRVCALVDGERIWYTCDDVELIASPEAFGSWLLLPSLHHRRRLTLDEPVSEKWKSNAAALSAIWADWWGYEAIIPDALVREEQNQASPDYALGFSCGVDSFHALITGPRPDLLVAVQGFDIGLEDEFRMMAFAASVEAVAMETGIAWTALRTNLRAHRSAGKPWLWERSHGGAIASIGHVLGNRIGRFGVAATYSNDNQHSWGSTAKTDPLFSSDRVAIEHIGADDHRQDKIRILADNPLAQRHLRVCWENRSQSGNCSRCAKCLATMLLLAELDALDKFPVFSGISSLAPALDELPYLKTQINIIDRLAKRGALPKNVNDAAARLVTRSRRAARLRKLRGYAHPRALGGNR
jgi:hypothetical protein